uniref:Uncharacterized protein n=1 Tax=Tanacetum cinerariifolium TaxID=118510 RepID=A0A699IH49_TANCI|nr:hypothetical protein [Tanacetum cinerariifolium]
MQLKQEEQGDKICTPYWKCPIFDDDDDDEEYTIQVREYYKNSPVAITPDFLITNSLIMEDEQLDTISKTEPDEEIESSVEDLNLTPSESEDLFDIESECDETFCDDFMTFSNPLFDSYDDSTSSDDESFSNEDCSLMEEIDIFLALDDSIPLGIENDDYDSEGDNLFLEELLTNDSLPKNKSFHDDRYYVPSSPRPLEKPPDDDGIYFDIEPDMEVLTGKVFNFGILASKEEKSPHFLSHRGFKAFQIIYYFSKSPMMIYEDDIPILDVLFLHFYPP